MAKIKVYDYGPDYRGINTDNAANSGLYAFDGNWNRPETEKFEFGIDVSYLMRRFPQCTFLSLDDMKPELTERWLWFPRYRRLREIQSSQR